ncbi:MAG: hypothetical protein JXA96_15055 [Sedimentisphaerales bacterium]|nr:hypothetical protein [Sedimentisphaerales bacterium]
MHLKSFIIGLFFLCIGGGMLWWIVSERHVQEQKSEEYKLKYGSETSEYIKLYDEWLLLPVDERTELPSGLNLNANKPHEQILQEQQERLIADMDKLAAGEITVYPIADEFYGRGWEDKIEKYKKQKEQMEFLYSVSIACASSGGLLTGWSILLSIARALIKMISKLKQSISHGKKDKEQTDNTDIENIDGTEKEQNEKLSSSENEEQQNDEHFKGISNVLANSGWQYAGSFNGEQKQRLRQRKRIPAKNRAIDSDSSKEKEAVKANSDSTQGNTDEKIRDTKPDIVRREKKISENKTESETVIKNDIDVTNAKGQTHHIDTTLKDLTQQVSAIREYAANQQNRLERLQDGYDWNIIKTFCLRIIRCIDNIEKRISQISDEDVQVIHLEEVRDELVFALESSGIEQFEPKVNTYYRGQEKIAEAIKEKAHSEDPNKKGKIEKVIKPGYQFYIDEDNVKIVRPAQVRIFA